MNYGKKIVFEDKTYYQPAQTESGLCYKDELAFYQGRGTICYIPSGSFRHVVPTSIDGEDYYLEDELALYTKEGLEIQAGRTGFTAEDLFSELDGCYPSAVLMAMAANDGCISIL